MSEAWSNEHQAEKKTTYLEYFKKYFPNAVLSPDGYPFLCRAVVFGNKLLTRYCSALVGKQNCRDCWDKEMSDE